MRRRAAHAAAAARSPRRATAAVLLPLLALVANFALSSSQQSPLPPPSSPYSPPPPEPPFSPSPPPLPSPPPPPPPTWIQRATCPNVAHRWSASYVINGTVIDQGSDPWGLANMTLASTSMLDAANGLFLFTLNSYTTVYMTTPIILRGTFSMTWWVRVDQNSTSSSAKLWNFNPVDTTLSSVQVQAACSASSQIWRAENPPLRCNLTQLAGWNVM